MYIGLAIRRNIFIIIRNLTMATYNIYSACHSPIYSHLITHGNWSKRPSNAPGKWNQSKLLPFQPKRKSRAFHASFHFVVTRNQFLDRRLSWYPFCIRHPICVIGSDLSWVHQIRRIISHTRNQPANGRLCIWLAKSSINLAAYMSNLPHFLCLCFHLSLYYAYMHLIIMKSWWYSHIEFI